MNAKEATAEELKVAEVGEAELSGDDSSDGAEATGDVVAAVPAPVRKGPGTKEVIPFAWKLVGEANGLALTLFKSVEREDVEAQMIRVANEGYYKKLRILDADAPIKQAAASSTEAALFKGTRTVPPSKKLKLKKAAPKAEESTPVVVIGSATKSTGKKAGRAKATSKTKSVAKVKGAKKTAKAPKAAKPAKAAKATKKVKTSKTSKVAKAKKMPKSTKKKASAKKKAPTKTPTKTSAKKKAKK